MPTADFLTHCYQHMAFFYKKSLSACLTFLCMKQYIYLYLLCFILDYHSFYFDTEIVLNFGGWGYV